MIGPPAEEVHVDRRSALVTLFSPAFAALWRRAAADAPSMRITRVDTVYWESRDDAPFWPHWTWLRLHTDNGFVGLGETYPRNPTESALVHSDVAKRLLGRDPRDVEAIWSELFRAFDYQISGGTEMRVLSAVDLALWDLLGQALGAPVWRLIGGRTNPRVPVYNTCFPLRHDFNVEPEKIMREVRERYGVKGIKIWPFDGAAHRSRHQHIAPDEVDGALVPLRRLRDAFGDEIEIMLELHSNWNLPSALRIARAVEPYKPMWLEDVLLTGSLKDYRELAAATPDPHPALRADGRALRVRGPPRVGRRPLRLLRPDVVRRPQPGPQGRRRGRGAPAPRGPAHGRRAPPLLRLDAPHDRDPQRRDPGELPAVLRAGLAGHARGPDRARRTAPWPPRISPASACG